MFNLNPSPNFNFRSKSSLMLLLFLCLFQTLVAQTPDARLAQVNANDYPEKIYIQYDKPSYFAGETIWFKAYLMEGFYPATNSTVLAVELLNDSGRVIEKKALPIKMGAASGDFSLSPALRQGNYIVRAYTRRHMNNGAKRLYQHAVNIYNPSNTSSSETTTGDSNFVYFFPEGGNFIGNIKNSMAFRCSDKWGHPQEIEGKIVDSKGGVITSFKSTHNGMGKLIFTPGTGEKYTAECVINSTLKKTIPLPEVLSQGVNLQVNSVDSKTYFYIDATTVNIQSLMPSYVLGVQENMVAFKIPLDANNKEIKGRIPVEKLPSGILQITVFNADNKPLAERLTFLNSGDYIPGSFFKTDTLNFDQRQKNVFSFNLKDPAIGTYAVSITALNDDVNTGDNIISRLLLTEDIKGFVYNPAYYFEENNEKHAQDLDLVMLTNGWRRYNWNEVLSYTNAPPVFKDPVFITFSAVALDPATKAPVQNMPLSIFVKTKDNFSDFLITETDSSGFFMMPGMVFEDTMKLSFSNATNKKERMHLQIKSQPISYLLFVPKQEMPKYKFRSVSENSNYFKSNAGRVQENYTASGLLMKEIQVVTKAKTEKEKFEKKYTTGRLGSSASTEIDFLSEPVTSGLSIIEYLKSRLGGVTITGGPFDYSINYRGARSLSSGLIPMAVFLDEFQVEPGDLSTIRVSDVAMVKVFSNALTSAGGALAIYTKRDRGTDSNTSLDKTDVFVEGFSPTKEFFSPNYGDSKADKVIADERSTLYWNPYLETSAQNSKLYFSFYNSDNAKQFKVVIEGVLEDGKLLHIEQIVK